VRTIHYTPPAAEAAHWDGWSPRSVSLDAAYVAVGWNGTDPSRRDDSFAILDAATSKPVVLPEKEIGHAEFLADGTVLVQAPHGTKLDILDSHFRLSRTIPLPAGVTDLRLVRYVG
jgi:TolB protein